MFVKRDGKKCLRQNEKKKPVMTNVAKKPMFTERKTKKNNNEPYGESLKDTDLQEEFETLQE